MRLLTHEDIENLAVGAALIGGGGGGGTYISKLQAQQAIAAHGPVRLIDLDELDDNALVISLCVIGAPTVGIERPFGESTFVDALGYLERHLGRRADALMTLEIGGLNALTPLPVAAQLGLPVVDADAMGRALPELQMTSFAAHGFAATPLVLYGDDGSRVLVETPSPAAAERMVRSLTTELGGSAASADYPLLGSQVKQAAIPHSISRTIEIGQMIRVTNTSEQRLAMMQDVLGDNLLFQGRVMDVRRQTDIGFARGEATLAGTGIFQSHTLAIHFQNEYLVALLGSSVRASVPEIIVVFDLRSGDPIPVESLRYGQQVAVLVLPAPLVWRTPAGLALVGPRAFGYAFDYVPFEPSVVR